MKKEVIIMDHGPKIRRMGKEESYLMMEGTMKGIGLMIKDKAKELNY